MAFTKYDGTRHWWGDLTLLGADGFGVWLGGGPDTPWRRPGRTIVAGVHWVNLVPQGRRHVATFNAPGGTLSAGVYVDVTDRPAWVRQTPGGRLRVVAVDRPEADQTSAPQANCTPDSYATNPAAHQYCCRSHETAEAEWADTLAERRRNGELNPEVWPPVVDDTQEFDVPAAGPASTGDDTSPIPTPTHLTIDDLD